MKDEKILTEVQPKPVSLKPVFDFKTFVGEEPEQGNTPSEDSCIGLFDLLKATVAQERGASQPEPRYLTDDRLIQEHEFVILFADTGIGKTVLACQEAIEIAGKGHVTLFLDLELSLKQFQRRTTGEDGTMYRLPDTLYRLGFSRLKKIPKDISYEDYFFDSLLTAIRKTNAKVIFLDNLTKLAAGDTDTAKAAIPILERLNDLKAEEGLTIIVLEHNKKVDTSRPIQLNDLQGSKMKSNLVDAVFTIGRSSKDKNLRYIKQLKVRDGEIVYDTENVKVCEISKAKGYLSFTHVGFESEYCHLKQITEKDREETKVKAKELSKIGKSQRQIASELGVAVSTVNKYLKL